MTSTRPAGLLLTPGAGASRDNATLVRVEAELTALDPPLAVERIDFPYRIAGRRMPDRPPVAVAHVREETARMARTLGVGTERLLLGGRSFGGRMCSMAVAEGLPAAGLVLLSYPLHPPGRPEKLRVDHFGAIDVPVLFVSGDADPFGSPAELAQHAAVIPGPTTLVTLRGAHDLRRKEADVARAVADWVELL